MQGLAKEIISAMPQRNRALQINDHRVCYLYNYYHLLFYYLIINSFVVQLFIQISSIAKINIFILPWIKNPKFNNIYVNFDFKIYYLDF